MHMNYKTKWGFPILCPPLLLSSDKLGYTMPSSLHTHPSIRMSATGHQRRTFIPISWYIHFQSGRENSLSDSDALETSIWILKSVGITTKWISGVGGAAARLGDGSRREIRGRWKRKQNVSCGSHTQKLHVPTHGGGGSGIPVTVRHIHEGALPLSAAPPPWLLACPTSKWYKKSTEETEHMSWVLKMLVKYVPCTSLHHYFSLPWSFLCP